MGRKFYVVWEGRHPGVYEDWEDALEQVDNFPGAKFKGFSSQEEAVEAFRKYLAGNEAPLGEILVKSSSVSDPKVIQHGNNGIVLPDFKAFPEIDPDGWAVDASCLGNPGIMEYRGVELKSGLQIFRVGPLEDATNNIGEFLAIVHALALQFNSGKWHTIYSDSATGMSWVKNKRVKTTLKPTVKNERVFQLMARALNWLSTHHYDAKILKWQTERWGEIPADFGRK